MAVRVTTRVAARMTTRVGVRVAARVAARVVARVATRVAARVTAKKAARVAAKAINFEKKGLPRPGGLWQNFENFYAILNEEEPSMHHDHNGLRFSDTAERIVVRV